MITAFERNLEDGGAVAMSPIRLNGGDGIGFLFHGECYNCNGTKMI
jgi:hypothetical protein